MNAEDALLENYQDVKRLAHSFAYRFGYDGDDLTQEACMIFLRYWERRPEGMPASSFIRCYVNYQLITLTRRGQRSKAFSNSESPDLEQVGSGGCWGLLVDLLDSVSEDVRTIVRLYTDTPAELRDLLRRRCRGQVVMKKYLQARGWSRNRIEASLNELEEACTN